MKFEDRFCTLEQSQKLKEMGVKGKSYFVWTRATNASPHAKGFILKTREQVKIEITTDQFGDKFSGWLPGIPAFSCAELGILLPSYCLTPGEIKIQLITIKSSDNFECGYMDLTNWHMSNKKRKYATHEAHAKADLLIHLLKEKLIKPEDLKL
jgi:hypothetical protein